MAIGQLATDPWEATTSSQRASNSLHDFERDRIRQSLYPLTVGLMEPLNRPHPLATIRARTDLLLING